MRARHLFTAPMQKLLVLVFCVLALVARGADPRPPEFYDLEVQQLLSVDMFAFGGVGFAGQTSAGEAAFGAVVAKKEAIRFILAAFEYGNAPARCYALVALRESSPKLFQESLARLRKSPPKKIRVMSGCLIDEVEPEGLFKAIEDGSYASWFKRYEEKG